MDEWIDYMERDSRLVNRSRQLGRHLDDRYLYIIYLLSVHHLSMYLPTLIYLPIFSLCPCNLSIHPQIRRRDRQVSRQKDRHIDRQMSQVGRQKDTEMDRCHRQVGRSIDRCDRQVGRWKDRYNRQVGRQNDRHRQMSQVGRQKDGYFSSVQFSCSVVSDSL